jgi:hypothetical protein
MVETGEIGVKLVLGVAALSVAVGATATESRVPTATCGDSIHVIGQPPPPPEAKLALGRVKIAGGR